MLSASITPEVAEEVARSTSLWEAYDRAIRSLARQKSQTTDEKVNGNVTPNHEIQGSVEESKGISRDEVPVVSEHPVEIDGRSPTGYVGLVNQGATCYLNSLLQTLYHTQLFKDLLFKWEYDPETHGEETLCIPRQLQTLFAQLELSAKRAAKTNALTKR